MRNLTRALFVLGLMIGASAAAAQTGFGGASDHGFGPSVPISSFARPAAWLDASRMQVSTELSFGTGFGGGPAQGLQVTRLRYQLGQPLAMRVSVGNAFGASGGRDPSFFLEGLDVAYQPFSSFLIQVHYQDVRSPLQYSRSGFFDPYRR
jgi:hypothetical protein